MQKLLEPHRKRSQGYRDLLSLPLNEKGQLGRESPWSRHSWGVLGPGAFWRRTACRDCRSAHDSSCLSRAAHVQVLPNVGQVRIKVSWLGFHPDTAGSSMIKQIVALTPTASPKAKLAFGSVGLKARMGGLSSTRASHPAPRGGRGKGSAGVATYLGEHPRCGKPEKSRGEGSGHGPGNMCGWADSGSKWRRKVKQNECQVQGKIHLEVYPVLLDSDSRNLA